MFLRTGTKAGLGRQRKRNEALAKRIFGRGRRQGGSHNGYGKRRAISTSRQAGGAAVTKVLNPRSIQVENITCFREEHSQLTYRFLHAQQRTASNPPTSNANINSPWTHDLHSLNNSQASQASPPRSRPRSPSRAERAARDDRIYETIPSDATFRASSNGLSIRGSAGPFTVVASNFAPGTTAEDIEVALESTGGEIASCGLISTYPTVDAEIVFYSKRGAEDVVAAFNNQRVRLLILRKVTDDTDSMLGRWSFVACLHEASNDSK